MDQVTSSSSDAQPEATVLRGPQQRSEALKELGRLQQAAEKHAERLKVHTTSMHGQQLCQHG